MSWGWTKLTFARAHDVRVCSVSTRGTADHSGGAGRAAAACRRAAGQGGGSRGESDHHTRPGASGHPQCPIRTISSARNLQNEAMTWNTLGTNALEHRLEFYVLPGSWYVNQHVRPDLVIRITK